MFPLVERSVYATRDEYEENVAVEIDLATQNMLVYMGKRDVFSVTFVVEKQYLTYSWEAVESVIKPAVERFVHGV